MKAPSQKTLWKLITKKFAPRLKTGAFPSQSIQIVLNIRAKLERLGHKTAEAQILWFPETDTYSGLRDGRPLRKALLDGDANMVLTLLERICGS